MLEVFTIGGGEYIVNVFNAVAAWTGDGGYKSLIQVAMVMGLTMALITVAFNADWKAWMHWFLQATLIYMCLMVPRIDVQVTDRINPGLAPATVANVPLGLAALASFTSQVGDYLVTSSELVFGLPGDLNYSANGMIYASRLFEATQAMAINDPEFATNLDEHIRQCVFYDVLLGRKSLDVLAKSDDLWAAMGPGSVARSQRFLTRSGDEVTSTIITCRAAYTSLAGSWAALIDAQTGIFGRQLYPKQTEALARAKLLANLPVAYQYLTGVSKSANEILRQQLLVNSMGQAMHTMAGSSGVSSVDVYAQTRAEIQTRNTYNSIAHNAMKWVPILHIVLTVMFYALFPVLFPLFMFPGGGGQALKGYVTGFFYLAAWGPLYVVLHMIMNFKAAGDVAAAGFFSNGLSLASAAGISSVNSDVGILSGYLVASIPFLAAGVARGAMSIAGQATSYLNPSQNAAEEAARESSTGNIALGNTSLDNFSFNSRQGNSWSTAPNLMAGAPAMTTRMADGTTYSQYPGGSVFDTRGAISNLPMSFGLTEELQGAYTTSATESRSKGETLSTQASESLSSGVTQSVELARRLSSGNTLERSFGKNDSNSIGDTLTRLRQHADRASEESSLSKDEAYALALQRFQGGTFSASARANTTIGTPGKGILGSGISANLSTGWSGERGARDTNTQSQTESASSRRAKAMDYLDQVAASENWDSRREEFNRVTQSSSNQDIRSLSQSSTANFARSNQYENQARQYYEQAQRFEKAASLTDREGSSYSENRTQAFVDYVRGEQAKNYWEQPAWSPERDGFVNLNGEQRRELDNYRDRFVAAEQQRIRDGIEPSITDVGPAQIARPSVSTQAGIEKLAGARAAALEGGYAPAAIASPTPGVLTADEEGRRDAADSRLRSEGDRLEGVTERLKPEPRETLRRKVPIEEQDNDSIDVYKIRERRDDRSRW